jgi:hypothetical protein
MSLDFLMGYREVASMDYELMLFSFLTLFGYYNFIYLVIDNVVLHPRRVFG